MSNDYQQQYTTNEYYNNYGGFHSTTSQRPNPQNPLYRPMNLEQIYWSQSNQLRGRLEDPKRLNSEKCIWVLVTAITNLIPIPLLFRKKVLLKRHLIFEACLTAFTLLCSFAYHFCDSMDFDDWASHSTLTYGLYIGEGKWHRLDNIGAILCFVVLLVHWTNYQNNSYAKLNKFIALFIVICCQEKDPWNMQYTIAPIVLQLIIMLLKWTYFDNWKTPTFNMYFVKRSIIWQSLAFLCFYKGLNEDTDPYRLFHGLWHMLAGIASVYHWQAIQSHREDLNNEVSTMKKDSLFV
jgi:hypothetical protein